ncbi:unnamed protein product [Microthlaspi erraticum]|uniref:Uncharacterized protein n=1 Tax=Microthlaspi erraticum TaxID=1685480 RepID=A0A6D2IM71_9BRAS|nr:unnamed protein product [Microthlaspi erraticum]
MDCSSNPTITDEEFDRFLDAPDEFYYDCFPIRSRSHRQHSANPSAASLRRRKSAPIRNLISSDVDSEPSSSSSNGFQINGKPSSVEKGDFETSEDVSDLIESTMDLIDISPEKENDLVVITEVTDSGRDRVDPFQEGNCMSEDQTGESTVSDDEEDDYSGSEPPPRPEPNSADSSLLLSLAGLVFKAIEFQVNLMIGFVKYPPLLLSWCFRFFFDPFFTIKLIRRILTKRVSLVSDMIFRLCPSLASASRNFSSSLLMSFKSLSVTSASYVSGLPNDMPNVGVADPSGSVSIPRVPMARNP